MLCNPLLDELDGAEVRAAEFASLFKSKSIPAIRGWIRVAGRRRRRSIGLGIASADRLSGGTIADVARVLETRGADLDKSARELLKDEVAALDVDLAILDTHLVDRVDWDSEFECLLAGEVAPFDDLARLRTTRTTTEAPSSLGHSP